MIMPRWWQQEVGAVASDHVGGRITEKIVYVDRLVSGEEYVRRVYLELMEDSRHSHGAYAHMLELAASKLYEIACRPWFEDQGPAGNLARKADAIERREKMAADILNNGFSNPVLDEYCRQTNTKPGFRCPTCGYAPFGEP